VELLNKRNIKTTFFVLSEMVDIAKEQILYANRCGHEIACHGKYHKRPLTMKLADMENELKEAKDVLSNLIGKEVIGYRAPCYSIDNERYEIVKRVGFKYSSSKIDVPGHPLYGKIDMNGYKQPLKNVYEKEEFTEFALSTKKFCGKNIVISGGGWIRLFPWNAFMKPLIKSYLKTADIYTLYIHPFELSNNDMPNVEDVSFITKVRSTKGLHKVDTKIEQLIDLLEVNKYEFKTFAQVSQLLNKKVSIPI
jgi:hypothetical protein